MLLSADRRNGCVFSRWRVQETPGAVTLWLCLLLRQPGEAVVTLWGGTMGLYMRVEQMGDMRG